MNIQAMYDFSGKVAVITGGAGVLCSAFAEVLAEAGASVAILDIDGQGASRVADAINEKGGRAAAFRADCLSRESLEEAHKAVLATFGETDILINGAGGNNPRATTANEYFDEEAFASPDTVDFFKLKSEGIRFVFDLNVTAAFLTTQVFAADMAKRKSGNILNISSMNAYRPLTKIPAYSAAKAAVSNFTEWLAVHFANAGIRVNAIAPGFFVTNQNRALLYDGEGTPTARTEKILASTPMRRFGEAEELLGGMLYLLSDRAASFVTGVVLPIDGGFASYSGV